MRIQCFNLVASRTGIILSDGAGDFPFELIVKCSIN